MHMQRIVLDVGGDAPQASGHQRATDLPGERGLHDAALVMPHLGPRIGEVRPNLGHHAVGHDLEQFGGVDLRDAQVSATTPSAMTLNSSGALTCAMRRLPSPCLPASSIVWATPGSYTSSARKFMSGCAAAAATMFSPCPVPISTISGLSLPHVRHTYPVPCALQPCVQTARPAHEGQYGAVPQLFGIALLHSTHLYR